MNLDIPQIFQIENIKNRRYKTIFDIKQLNIGLIFIIVILNDQTFLK